MIQAAKWAARRLWCTFGGHRMTPGRFYYPPAKSVESGYVCDRCGKSQLLRFRWQEAVADE